MLSVPLEFHSLSLFPPRDKATQQAMSLLLNLGQDSPDVSHTIVQHLMGLSKKTTPTATPLSVELLHRLCIPDTEESSQRFEILPSFFHWLPSLCPPSSGCCCV